MSKLRKLMELLKVAGRQPSGQRMRRNKPLDTSTIDERLGSRVMAFYETLSDLQEKTTFFHQVSDELGIDIEAVEARTDKLKVELASRSSLVSASIAELGSACTPRYLEAIKVIGQAEGGIRFLVKLRADLLDVLHLPPSPSPSSPSASSSISPSPSSSNSPTFSLSPSTSPSSGGLRALSDHLMQALAQWFSPGLLTMIRLTWKDCSAELLQKVMEGEKVQPIGSWDDLKRRLDERDRRAFAFLHPCLGPHEPLVILHCALVGRTPLSSIDLSTASSSTLPIEASSVQAILHSTPSPPTSPPTLHQVGVIVRVG